MSSFISKALFWWIIFLGLFIGFYSFRSIYSMFFYIVKNFPRLETLAVGLMYMSPIVIMCITAVGFLYLAKIYKNNDTAKILKEFLNKYLFTFLFYIVLYLTALLSVQNSLIIFNLMFNASGMELGAIVAMAALFISIPVNIALVFLLLYIKKWKGQLFQEAGTIKKILTIGFIILSMFLLGRTTTFCLLSLVVTAYMVTLFKECQNNIEQKLPLKKSKLVMIIFLSLLSIFFILLTPFASPFLDFVLKLLPASLELKVLGLLSL